MDRYLFEAVRLELEKSGLPDELQKLVNPRQTGAPRRLKLSVLLAAMILVFRGAGSATGADIHRLLVTKLDRDLQVELKIRDSPEGAHDEGNALTYRQVQYLFHQVTIRSDPRATDDPSEQSRRKEFLTRLQTVYACLMIPKGVSKGVGVRAADSTPIHAWHHAWSGRDRDATTGYRTKTSSDRRDKVYGYRALTYCHASERAYVEAFSVRPAHEGEGEANLALAEALANMLAADGLKLEVVAADMGFSQLRAENWVEPMRELGAEPVFDYHTNDRGVLMVLGAKVTDGRPYCPCLPAELEIPARPPRVVLGKPPADNGKKSKRDKYEADSRALEQALDAVERRHAYMGGHVKGKGYGEGDVWRCPALEGKLRCERRPDSLFLPDDRPYLDPGEDTENGEFCKEPSIDLPGDVQPKLRQRHTWMERKWRSLFRRRTYAEGVFGEMRDRRTEAIGRGWIRVSGLIATTFMVWAAISHHNLRVAGRGSEDDGKDFGFRDLARPPT